MTSKEPFNLNPQLIEPKAWRSFNYSRFGNSTDCLNKLKKDDYIALASCLFEDSRTLDELVDELDLVNIPEKLVIAFGNESRGASDNLIVNSDFKFKIPMFGFAQPFNTATSLAIVLTLLDQLGVSKHHGKFSFSNDEVEFEIYEWLLRRAKASTNFEQTYSYN